MRAKELQTHTAGPGRPRQAQAGIRKMSPTLHLSHRLLKTAAGAVAAALSREDVGGWRKSPQCPKNMTQTAIVSWEEERKPVRPRI